MCINSSPKYHWHVSDTDNIKSPIPISMYTMSPLYKRGYLCYPTFISMENWDFQGSWGGVTVCQDYAKMMMTLHNHKCSSFKLVYWIGLWSHWALALSLPSTSVSSDFSLCGAVFKKYTYFTLPCRGLGLVEFALYLWWTGLANYCPLCVTLLDVAYRLMCLLGR